jgi:hypothetical protein
MTTALDRYCDGLKEDVQGKRNAMNDDAAPDTAQEPPEPPPTRQSPGLYGELRACWLAHPSRGIEDDFAHLADIAAFHADAFITVMRAYPNPGRSILKRVDAYCARWKKLVLEGWRER